MRYRAMLIIAIAILGGGCDQSVVSLHARVGWKASDYFKDAQVIKLCEAIEGEDLDEIERIVADGADVNAQGKDGMTPLLWAYPDNKISRFRKLLSLGADPNAIVSSDFGTDGTIRAGTSVTHLAAETKFAGYFEEVMKYGDPRLTNGDGLSLLRTVIKAVIPVELKKKRLRILIEKGAEIDGFGTFSTSPAMLSIDFGGQYEIALLLLEAGASCDSSRADSNRRLVHSVVQKKMLRAKNAVKQGVTESEKRIVEILQEHGESLADAEDDLNRWAEWGKTRPGEFKKLMLDEVAARAAEMERREGKSN